MRARTIAAALTGCVFATVAWTTLADLGSAAGPEAQASVQSWAISAQPTVVIGAGGEPGHELDYVYDAARLADGRIVVANGGREVRYYSATGQYLFQHGRPGAGPGEYRAMRRLHVARGDTLWLYDNLLPRFTVLSPSGSLVRVVRLEARGSPGLVGTLANGTLVVGPVVRRWIKTGPSTEAGELEYRFLTPDGRAIGATIPFRGPDAFVVTFRDGRGQRALPFAVEPTAATSQTHLYSASPTADSVYTYDSRGSLTRVFSLGLSPRRVSQTDITRLLEIELSALASESARRSYRELFRQLPKPDIFPALRTLIVDSYGLIWCESFAYDPDREAWWTIVDSLGRTVAKAKAPPGVSVTRIGPNYVVGIRRLPGEPDQVGMYSLVRTAPD